MPSTLFTIGHSNRSLDEFLSLLRQYSVTALCDVRSAPYSRRYPQFNREPLKEAVRSAGIEYLFLGDELGARARDRSCYVDGKAMHSRIASTAAFKGGLERIRLGMEKGYLLALMCAERDPMTCHRSILICRNLRDQDLAIRHIIDRDATETQADLETRLLDHLKLLPDLFEDARPEALIERAYDLQSDRIAYVEKDPLEA